MQFIPLEVVGVLGIVGDSHSDSRGTLTRVWDSNSVLDKFNLIQSSIVSNPKARTLRGLHYQAEPFSENKVIECVAGKVFDVVIDLRKDSHTYGEHLEVVLGPSEAYLGLFVPAGCAHGYLTLEPNSTLLYFMDKPYSADHARGIHWMDSKLLIRWPSAPLIVSESDASWPQL